MRAEDVGRTLLPEFPAISRIWEYLPIVMLEAVSLRQYVCRTGSHMLLWGAGVRAIMVCVVGGRWGVGGEKLRTLIHDQSALQTHLTRAAVIDLGQR